MRLDKYFLFLVILTMSLSLVIAEDLSSDSRDLSEWRMDGRNLDGTRYYPGKIPQDISQLNVRSYSVTDYTGDPTIANGSMYGTCLRESLYRLNASNVSQRLDKTLSYTLFPYPMQPIWNGFTYGGSEYGTIYQFNLSNLSQVIATNNLANAQHYGSMLVYGGYAYFTDWHGTSGNYIYQVNASNVTQWISRYSVSGCDGAPAISQGYIYYGCGSTIYQLNATNVSIKYAHYTSGGSINTGSGVSVSNGFLYFGSEDFRFYQLNATNVSQQIANFSTGAGIYSSPAVARGFVYFGGGDGYTYQLNASNISQQIANYSTGPVYEGPSVTDDYLLIGGSQMYQLNATNISQKIANYSLSGAGVPSIANGIIYWAAGYKFYQFGTEAPLVTQDSPSSGYVLNQNSEEINFSCSTFDFIGLVNVSLYITNNQSSNFSLNQTTAITAQTNSTIWSLNLSKGNYLWGCLVYDVDGNLDWSSNRTLAPDTTAPILNITYPLNNSNSSNINLNINYSVSDSGTGVNSCWYSNDTMSMNNTLSNCANLTSVTWSEGQHNLTIWANDSVGNIASRSIKFTIDITFPIINIVAPTNNSNSTNNRLNVNYTFYDINKASCWYSNDSYSRNTTLTNCANITTVTWGEGHHNVTIWINDSAGNRNSSSVLFYIDSIPPVLNIIFPINNSFTKNANLNINYTVFDSGVGVSSCWYSNDSMSSNITLTNCVNITTVTWSEGQHNLTIWANDSFDNKNNSIIRFTIDNIVPLFNNLTNQTSTYGNVFSYQINATDIAGISCFTLNDTTNFNVNCSGYLRNNTLLNVGLYSINITLNDSANNINSALMFVNVSLRPLIGLTLISPTSNINATQNQTFQVSVNVSCSNTNCGEVNVSLDPIIGGTTVELFVGNISSAWGSGSSTYADPINTYYHDVRVQSIYLASDLRAAGIPAGASIRQLYLNISQLPGRTTLANFRIRMNHTNLNITSSAITTWNTTAYGPVSIPAISLAVNRLVEFNFTNNFTWDGISNIIIDFSRDDSGWSSNGGLYVITGLANGRSFGGASDSGYTWPFDSMVTTSYGVVPKIWLTYVGGSSAKNGLVSTNVGATPFYTTTKNPYNLTLNNGESQIITWTVNATGTLWANYTFFVYANKTSDLSISNITAKWNVTIVNFTMGITPPSVTITFPSGLQNYSSNVSELNYTVFGENLSVCWYSSDSGITNSSYVDYGVDFNNLISVEGVNNWVVYCNGTNNTIGMQSVVFYKDSVFPKWSSNKTNLTSITLNHNIVYFNITLEDINPGLYIFSWYNGTSWVNDSTSSYLFGQEILVNKTINVDVGIINWTWYFNDSFGNSNQTTIWGVILVEDNLEGLSISCEVGGPYQQNAVILFQGNVSNSTSIIANHNVSITLFNSSSLAFSSNLTTSSFGTFQQILSSLSVGSYNFNVSTSKNGYNKTCQDSFTIGGPALLVLDKIITVNNISNSTISYNLTLKLTNSGDSDSINTNITDLDFIDGFYSIGNLPAGSNVERNYLKSFERSETYYFAFNKAEARGLDSFSGNLITVNSTSINLSIPGLEIGQNLLIVKNVYYNSENSTSLNYTLSIAVINSGDVNLEDISLIDGDLGLAQTISLNVSKTYNYSLSILIDKAASNIDKLFTKTNAVANGIIYQSNQINIRIPGYGGPADTYVYALESVASLTSFDSIIMVKNLNRDIGQNFIIDYWITNDGESINYSSGQATVYVAPLSETNTTITLTSPTSAGNYRLRVLTSYVNGLDSAYDSFIVSSSNVGANPISYGGGGIVGNVVKDDIVCNLPYIRHGIECCLDTNNNSICDSDEIIEISSSGDEDFVNVIGKIEVDATSISASIKNISSILISKILSVLKSISRSWGLYVIILLGILIVGYWSYGANILKRNYSNRLSGCPGKKVYSQSGDYIGKVEEVFINNNRLDGWLLVLDKKFANLLMGNKILVKQIHIRSIGDVILIDDVINDYLERVSKK